MTPPGTRRRTGLALLGVTLFLAKRSYGGPMAGFVASYGGNFAVSFAVYFIAAIAATRHGFSRLTAAAAARLVFGPVQRA